MNMKAAFIATLELADDRGFIIAFIPDRDGGSEMHSRAHAQDLLNRWDAECGHSPAKQGRWLGWLQGMLCGTNFLTVPECKEINRRFRDEEPRS